MQTNWNENIKAILVGVSDYSAYRSVPDLPQSSNDVSLMSMALVQGLKINPYHIWIHAEAGTHAFRDEAREAGKFESSSDEELSNRIGAAKDPAPHAAAGRWQLSSRLNGHITKSTFLTGIRLFMQDVKDDDCVIFYFSGHGAVKNNRHYLLFGDGPLETQSVIDLFAQLNVRHRILFLDCCMSGLYRLEDPGVLEPDDWLEKLMDGGTAVFTSGRAEERAGYSREMAVPASVFTTFLWNAMTNRCFLHHGQLSLDTIRRLVDQETDAWNERHPDRMQHPVFRSSMAGTVWFQVADYRLYEQGCATYEQGYQLGGQMDSHSDMGCDQHEQEGSLYGKAHHDEQQRQHNHSEQDDYLIAEVAPLHSRIAKRYAVKVILKHAVTRDALVRINEEIVDTVRPLEIYKSTVDERRWTARKANLIFIYYGYSREDVAQGSYEFITTWADQTQDKTHWYRTGPHRQVQDGVLIQTNTSYPLLRQMAEEGTADQDTILRQTKDILRQLINDGERIVAEYQEFHNGIFTLTQMRQRTAERCKDIRQAYLRACDLPIPPVELTKWSLLAAGIAADTQEMAVVLADSDRTSTRTGKAAFSARMDYLIARFHQDMEELRSKEFVSQTRGTAKSLNVSADALPFKPHWCRKGRGPNCLIAEEKPLTGLSPRVPLKSAADKEV